MKKNTAGQKWRVYAWNRSTGVPATGIAATITATINKDFAGEVATDDVNPTEIGGGYYEFTLLAEETNAYHLSLTPATTTNGVGVRALPETLTTETAAAVEPSTLTAQNARDAMKLAPTAGDPAAGSVDKHLDDIATDVAGLDGAAMRGTDGAYTGTPPTADAIGTDTAGKVLVTPSQKIVTNAGGQVSASNALTGAEMFAAILTTQMTEAYAADGVAPTLAQAIFLIQQSLHEFAISGTTRTVKKLDGAATAATFTLDSATAPTSTTRAT